MGSMTQSLEDYLETLYVLSQERGSACVRDVAKALGVKMPSVVKAIRELKCLELAVQKPYAPIELTEKGRRVAMTVLGRHNLLKSFLESLGVSRRIADIDACRMEHILSAETLDRIREFNARTGAAKAPRKDAKTSKKGRTK
jgi:DtxR family Mn-dependent transcriptional regulator